MNHSHLTPSLILSKSRSHFRAGLKIEEPDIWYMTVAGHRFTAGLLLSKLTTSFLAAACLMGGMLAILTPGGGRDHDEFGLNQSKFMILDIGYIRCLFKRDSADKVAQFAQAGLRRNTASTFPNPAQERTRGVRLLNPGEEMLPSGPPQQEPQLAGPNGATVSPVRVAVADGQSAKLDGMIAREAPFEIVLPAAKPDLVWDPVSHNVSIGPSVVAYNIDAHDLPAVIDRTAAVRALKDLAAIKPQIMRFAGADLRHRGDRVEIDVENVASRALILFNIAGDGTVQALYPLGSDPRVLDTKTYHLSVQIREPFGTDTLVAVTAGQPMDRLEQGIKQISHFHSAGQALRLVISSIPSDARIGLASLSSSP